MKKSIFFLCLCAMLAGCGYHRMGGIGTSEAPGAGKTHVQIFTNRSYRAGLETTVTQKVIDEVGRHSGGNAVAEADAQLILSGVVMSYTVAPVAYNAADIIAEYRATLKVLATLSERQTGKVLWKGEVAESQNYPANNKIALQQNNEAAAIDEISRRLAEQLHERMQDGF